MADFILIHEGIDESQQHLLQGLEAVKLIMVHTMKHQLAITITGSCGTDEWRPMVLIMRVLVATHTASSVDTADSCLPHAVGIPYSTATLPYLDLN